MIPVTAMTSMASVARMAAVVLVPRVAVVLAVTRVAGRVPVLTTDGVTGVTVRRSTHGLSRRGTVTPRHRVAVVLGLFRRRTVMLTVPARMPLVLDHRDSFRPEPTSPNRIPPGGIWTTGLKTHPFPPQRSRRRLPAHNERNMLLLLELLAELGTTSPPTSTPTPAPFNEDTVTPGLFGFLLTFLVAAAAVLLSVDMIRRVRRTTYREAVSRQLDLEEAEIAQQRADE